jgi:hypothetical protein
MIRGMAIALALIHEMDVTLLLSSNSERRYDA